MKEPDLQDALGRLAETLPRDVRLKTEERMMVAFRLRRKRPRRGWIYAAAIAACAIVALTWLAVTPSGPRSEPAGFVALPYADSGVPLEEGVIVRVEIPRAELRRLGAPVMLPAGTNGEVRADLLIGQDGIARAVRIVGK